MPASKSRFVTACQQMLALGVVVAVLTPALGVVTLDVVHREPGSAAAPPGAASFAAYEKAAAEPALVPTDEVEATVEEVSLTAPAGDAAAPPQGASGRTIAGAEPEAPASVEAKAKQTADGGTTVVSTPQDVTGYGAIGVTWDKSEKLSDADIALSARTLKDGQWSEWTELTYHDEHGPDPDSPEAATARPGTDELIVGEVDKVQVQAITSDGAAPADMKLAVVDPGEAEASEMEQAEYDTAKGSASVATPSAPSTPEAPAADGADGAAQGDAIDLQAAVYTPAPKIFSRAQWGANENLRDKSSLRYYEVHAGFVHHTVNSNDYTQAQVPGILRSIYAYHTRSRGWSDIGYNYLVDKFGRIWEGRAGGVDRPVVGAHTLGYNEYSFAMSAIGNYDIAQPNARLVQAYGALFAWKLSLHGVNAASTSQKVGPRSFPAINGHRDAGSTACPGRYLYAKLGRIRQLATAGQKGWAGRELESNLGGSPHPDLIVRRKRDQQLMVLPMGPKLAKAIPTKRYGRNISAVFNAGDWDRDGFGDIITKHKSNGRLYLLRGRGNGKFYKPVSIGTGFQNVSLITAVGDMTGDGWPDLMGQPAGGSARIYPGNGLSGLKASFVAYRSIPGSRFVGVGRWDADGAPDLLVRNGKTLRAHSGNGPGGLTRAWNIKVDVTKYDWTIGVRNMALNGRPDIVARETGTGRLWRLPSGTGTPVLLGTGVSVYDLAG